MMDWVLAAVSGLGAGYGLNDLGKYLGARLAAYQGNKSATRQLVEQSYELLAVDQEMEKLHRVIKEKDAEIASQRMLLRKAAEKLGAQKNAG